jgi:hypothetical protein
MAMAGSIFEAGAGGGGCPFELFVELSISPSFLDRRSSLPESNWNLLF